MYLNSIFNFCKKEKTLIFFLIFLAIITRFFYFGLPNEVVFDEVYFAKFTSDYFKGEYYFDIHPPLAKLILAGSAMVFGFEPSNSFDFKNIGKEYPSSFFKLLRFIVSFFGVLLCMAVYFLTKQLFHNKWIAFLAGMFVVFDNAILVQSRFVLTDVFLLVFGILGLGFLFILRKKEIFSAKWFGWLILTGLLLSASFAIKWTGLLFFGIAGLILLYDAIKKRKIEVLFIQFVILLIVLSLSYFSIFAIHLKLLPFSGDGDAYMSPAFKKSLIGSSIQNDAKPIGLFQKFVELNNVMFSTNAGLKADHPYGSKLYSWPLLSRPIYYWYAQGDVQEGISNNAQRIYFQGNPIIWWLGLIGMAYWSVWFLKELFKKTKDKYVFPIGILLAGYFANLFAYIFVSRVAFIYHYLPSLIFAIIGLGVLVWKYFKKYPLFIGFILLIVLLSFLFFSPLSYGIPLSEIGFKARLWFKGWE